MAPVHAMAAGLQSRAVCPSGYYYSDGFCYRNSGWYWWGRWVLLGVIVVIFLLFLLIMSRRVRRQRRQGVQPSYGTSWMGWGQNNQPQYNNQQNYAPPPPQYSQEPPIGANYTGGTYNSNEGYYGQNAHGTYNNDIPLQQPGTTYYPTRGANDDFAPPEGPPPTKK